MAKPDKWYIKGALIHAPCFAYELVSSRYSSARPTGPFSQWEITQKLEAGILTRYHLISTNKEAGPWEPIYQVPQMLSMKYLTQVS